MRRLLLTIPVLAAVALFSGFISLTASAQTDPPFYWESIDVLIDVQQNGDMVVTETQTYVFTGPHDTERFRRIPLEKVDGITSVRVSQDGRALPSDTDVDDGQLWIRWSHLPLNPPEKATFVVEYRVLGGLHLDEDGDQVYWKALFKERDAPINNARVVVRLPESLAGQVSEYQSFGAKASSRRLDRRSIEFTLDDPLPPRRGLEVQVAFPHGLLNVPTPRWQLEGEADSEPAWGYGGVCLILVLLLAAYLWDSNRTWPKVRYPTPAGPVTMPPNDLPAPVVSVLESHQITNQTFLAMLVEMCQQGRLRIAGSSARSKYAYRLSQAGPPQFPWEESVFNSIPLEQSITVGDLRKQMLTLQDTFEKQFDDYLRSRGLFNGSPLKVMRECQEGGLLHNFRYVAGVGAGICFGVLLNSWLPGFFSILAGIGMILLYWKIAHTPQVGKMAPTEKGEQEIGRWLHLRKSTGGLSRTTDSAQLSPLLPYAVALGAAKDWAERASLAPDWFASDSPTDGSLQGNLYYAYRTFVTDNAWRPVVNRQRYFGYGGWGAGGGGGGGGGGGAAAGEVAVAAASPLAGSLLLSRSP